MNKKCRILLYVLSIVMVAGCIAAVARTKGSTPEVKVPGEEPAAVVSGEDTEHAGADSGADRAPAREENETAVETTEAEERTEAAEVTEEAEAGGQAEADGSTTILFTGDVLFANAFKAGYDADGIKGVVAPELLEELQAADILMVNNEFPFSDRGTPMADKQFTFRCSPGYVKALNEMGVDVVSLANNHTLDYGREALSDTFAALDGAGILYGGAGDSAERAKQVQVIEVHGKKYGFIAVSRVVPTADWKVENAVPGLFSCYDTTALVEVIKEAKETCDYVAVYPHWGVEYQAYPEANQTQIAKACIDAGADVVVGSHTHCLQGVSYIDGKPVFYSLGNFIFGQSIDRSAMLEVTIDAAGRASYRFVPVYAAGGVTYPAEGGQAESVLNYLDGISEAAVASDGTVTED